MSRRGSSNADNFNSPAAAESDNDADKNVSTTSFDNILQEQQLPAGSVDTTEKQPPTKVTNGTAVVDNNDRNSCVQLQQPTATEYGGVAIKKSKMERQKSTARRHCRLLLGVDYQTSSSSRKATKRGTVSGSRSEKRELDTYVTNYGIDHKGQSEGLCLEVLLDECIPCCRHCCRRRRDDDDEDENAATSADKNSEGPSTPVLVGRILMMAIRSEVFLYTLHVTAIVLGAVKEGVGLRYSDPDLNLIQSSVETSATLLLIVIRMFNAFVGYRVVRRTLMHVVPHEDDGDGGDLLGGDLQGGDMLGGDQRIHRENNEIDNRGCCGNRTRHDRDVEIHITLIRKWMIVQLVAGALLFSTCISCFFVFLYYVHLGWTVLSNNFCLITITVLSSLYTARVAAAVVRIREDLHKIVIYDAQFVIRKGVISCSEGDSRCKSEAMTFTRAIDHTRLLQKPPYINLHKPVTTTATTAAQNAA